METEVSWHDWFTYDETSKSCLRWKVDRLSGQHYNNKQVAVGDEVGTPSKKGYYNLILQGKGHRTHRVVWEMFYGKIPPKMQVDHINQIKDDNRISNLRLVTNAKNKRNSGKYANNTSGVTGVRKIVMSGVLYWQATWADITHKRHSAHYNTVKLGFEEAFRLACERRNKEIAKLNEQGAGYSEIHGV